MVKIINPMQGENPLAAVLSSLGQQMFGDRSGGMLKAEQLYAAQRENAETDNLMRLTAGTPMGASGLGGNAMAHAMMIGAGYDPSDFAQLGLMGAATSGGPAAAATQGWQIANKMPFSSTADAVDAALAETVRGNNLQSADNRYGVDQNNARQWGQFGLGLAETTRNNDLQSADNRYGVDQNNARQWGQHGLDAAETTRNNNLTDARGRYNTDQTVAENARQFNLAPVAAVGSNGRSIFGTNTSVVDNPALTPPMSLTDAQGTMLNRNPPPVGSFAEAVTMGTAPSMEQVRADILLANEPGFTDNQRLASVDALPTTDNILAQLFEKNFNNLGDLDPFQREGLGVTPPNPPAPGTTWNYRLPNGQMVQTNDQMRAQGLDIDGNPLTPGGMRVGAEMAGTPDTWTNSVLTEMQGKEIGYQEFQATLNQAVDLAKDPTYFGATGNIRYFVQQAGDIARNLGLLVGGTPEVSIQDLVETQDLREEVKSLIMQDLQVSDPNIRALRSLRVLLAYSMAKANGSTGRDLSNQEMQANMTAIGDPTAWLNSQDGFLASLGTVDYNVRARRNARMLLELPPGAPPPPELLLPPADMYLRDFITRGKAPRTQTPTAPPNRVAPGADDAFAPQGVPPDQRLTLPPNPMAAPPAGAPVHITGDEEYLRLPSGTLYIGPDGLTRMKP